MTVVEQSKTERAYEWIKAKIQTHEFAPGHRLVISSIADELSVSPVPIREAIRQLEAEGLVTFARNVGARVTMIEPERYSNLMESVAVLEGVATALSAPNLDSTDLAEARKINSQLEISTKNLDPSEFTHLNKKFHQALFNKCPNQHLLDLVFSEWERLNYVRESTFAFVPQRAIASVREHEQIVALIEAGAEAAYIEKVARQHRLNTIDAYQRSS
ncbi:GntR family transcriptional regulator [Corynebacterium pseudopelargi]|uniref:HTH-type transcriptional repressor CsiR n=1 Tax=Corynebacterium pseudopelargi TaxID=2080757 RepID=A0A3G6IVE6_9CORY|nr:GntR family transcriptional regulator [Corynebacterium pseudopelargi]AZA09751.1 HTH-type transcriptional repressor CsiR [Corynebacterium pseudopelargi]